MSNIDHIIDDVLLREGGSKMTNDPNDPGGRTQYGISERANPEAWKDGKVTETEAREIYLHKYVIFPKFHLIPPSHSKLQEQLIDFGVHSGQQVAIKKLQEILGLDADGVIGPKTLAAISASDPRVVNNRLVEARILMIGRIVQKNAGQLNKLFGFLRRALGFLVP